MFGTGFLGLWGFGGVFPMILVMKVMAWEFSGDPLAMGWVVSDDDVFKARKVDTSLKMSETIRVLLLGLPPGDVSVFGHESGPVGGGKSSSVSHP